MTHETQFMIDWALWGWVCLLHLALVVDHISKGNKEAAIGWLAAFVWCVMSLKL